MIRIGPAQIKVLERTIDECQATLAPLKSFILPGGGMIAAFLHQARTVCRRAERDILRLMHREPIGDAVLGYVNRLSDLLFVLSRWMSHALGEPEYLWEKGLTLPSGPPPKAKPAAAKPVAAKPASAKPASKRRA
jgi:cob(I)alamin adenosyltransferase